MVFIILVLLIASLFLNVDLYFRNQVTKNNAEKDKNFLYKTMMDNKLELINLKKVSK